MENSKINWTDHTWNPWVGCRHVSVECDHCYADTMVTNRMGRGFSTVTRTKTWKDPIKWNRKAPARAVELGRRVRVFCASLTDFFIQDLSALDSLLRRAIIDENRHAAEVAMLKTRLG